MNLPISTTQIICVCADCHSVYLGGANSLYCPECRHKDRPERRNRPLAPELWDPIAVANHHPGGTTAQVWDRIRREARG